MELFEAEGTQNLTIRYEGTEGEEVSLIYTQDGSLATWTVYSPREDSMVEYRSDTGQTRVQRPFRNRS